MQKCIWSSPPSFLLLRREGFKICRGFVDSFGRGKGRKLYYAVQHPPLRCYLQQVLLDGGLLSQGDI